MKLKIIYISLVISLLNIFIFTATNNKFVYADSNSYGQINNDCLLYSDEDCKTALFSLPPTYFVEIKNETETSYAVKYIDIFGYVNKTSITRVDFTPSNLFANVNITLSDHDHIQLRKTPTTKNTDNIVTVLPTDATVEYYGEVESEYYNPADERSNYWSYIKYVNSNNESNYGYVNNIVVPTVTIPNNIFNKLTPNSKNTTSNLKNDLLVVIAIAISIPFILIIFTAFKKKRQKLY